MQITASSHIKYSIIECQNGMYQPQKEYGNKELYPAFNTLRDAHIFMNYVESDYKHGICGNVQIISDLNANTAESK